MLGKKFEDLHTFNHLRVQFITGYKIFLFIHATADFTSGTDSQEMIDTVML